MKVFLIAIRPLDVFLWTVRRNERDVVNLYHALSPIMQQATGGTMLNFGYWDKNTTDPLSAQENLCSYFGDLAELDSSQNVVDVGSGLSAPSIFWREHYSSLNLFCININLQQLKFVGFQKRIDFLNSTATALPLLDNYFDRVLALESAQHFRPFPKFIGEANRILASSGIFALALPVTMERPSLSKLGILKFTWSSEHYSYDYVKNSIIENGFKIIEENLIGKNVYEPLAQYYLDNRDQIKSSILEKYPKYVESVLFKSLNKMKDASKDKIIDYLILKCKKFKT